MTCSHLPHRSVAFHPTPTFVTHTWIPTFETTPEIGCPSQIVVIPSHITTHS
ncbi:hypothetical protein Syun_016539 [Stephania yunnanensis]|uniref:Uncharacterized protein n=1 Tax=Stephania yunnanensis TaxID=152371 RepID=A0AAP0J7N5_9MAGN